MTTPKQIAEWLAGLPHIHDVKPCTVTIRGGIYSAARYKQTTPNDPSTPAYKRGELAATREFIYCVGMLPVVVRNRNVVFMIDGEPAEWYVACYAGEVKQRKQTVQPVNEYHPFGNSFMLAPWDVPDGKRIDHYARAPYVRVATTVVED